MGKTQHSCLYIVLSMSTGAALTRHVVPERVDLCPISSSIRVQRARLSFSFRSIEGGSRSLSKQASYERATESGRAKGKGAILELLAILRSDTETGGMITFHQPRRGV